MATKLSNNDWKLETKISFVNTLVHNRHSSKVQEDKNKCWFMYYKVYFTFTYYLCIAPFRFQDSETGFVLHRNKFQSGLCFLLQCASLLYIRTTFLGGWDYVKLGTDRLSYFDLMFLVLLYGFDISTKLALWFHQSAFLDIFQSLENSPLLKISTKWSPLRVKVLVTTICTIYLIPSVFYICLVLGVNPSDTQGLIEGITVHTESLFILPEGCLSGMELSFIFKFMATFITIYTSAFWHYSDVLVLVSTLFFHQVSCDFFDALKREDIPPLEVLTYYDLFRSLNKKFNRAAGLVTCVFLTYPLSYYATHLVDMLNDSEIMNRFSMCIYMGNLSVTAILAAKIHLMCKYMKNWLWKQNSVLDIPIQQFSLILFELKNESLGVNGFFTITMSFAGEVVNLLLTLTIITVQFKIFEVTREG